ncbi:hypothetical protein ACFW1F_17400 [Streptomyces bungoensis]|uniref:hypothetical protein n=1 Tax=Streptomyces bungoensis TaxID=285568 RepID=UPI0034274C1C
MITTFRGRSAHALSVCALSAALVAGGSAAVSAAPTPTPMPSMTHRMASVTVKANPTTVKSGHQVRFTGRTAGIPVGASVRLQRETNGKWTTLKTSTMVKKGSTYALTTRPTTKGKQHYRVVVGKTHSATVTVTVQ